MNKLIYIITTITILAINVTAFAEDTYTIALRKGYNLIPMPVTPNNKNVADTFGSISSDVKDIWEYVAEDTLDTWKHYKPGLEKFSDLKEITVSKVYWVNVVKDTTVTLIGAGFTNDMQLNFKKGWNTFGWVYDRKDSIIDALSDAGLKFGIDYSQVSRYNNQTKQQENFTNNSEKDLFTEFEKGRAYYILMIRDKSAVITKEPKPDDTEPPVIVVAQPQSPTNNNVTVSYIVTDNISPQDKIIVSGNSLLYTQEGDHTVTLTATDEAGNSAVSNTITFTIDKTSPAIILTSPIDNSISTSSNIFIEGTVDTIPFRESRTLLYPGFNTITKEAIDNAGNKAFISINVIYSPGQLIGQDGGIVTSSDGSIQLIIPAGALIEPTDINLIRINTQAYYTSKPEDYNLSVGIQCLPEGLILLKDAQLIAALDNQEIPGTEIALGLYNNLSGELKLLDQKCQVASDGVTVNFNLRHFSEYFGLKNMISQGTPIGAGVIVPLPDLLTGSYSYDIPIAVPPGRLNIQPNLTLHYNSSNSNSWSGYGWSLNPGYIIRGNKYGIPKYDDKEDTFIFASNNSSTELVYLIDNLYQAKIEDQFAKFYKNSADSWKVIQKDGTALEFGTDLDSKEISGNGLAHKWYLKKVTDNNSNYIDFTYQKIDGKSYLSHISYTGNENTGFKPTHKIDFYLEDREDITSSYISGSKVLLNKRLKKIEVSIDGTIEWYYELNYESAPETNRSLLKSVCRYTSDNKPFPAKTFYYQKHDGTY